VFVTTHPGHPLWVGTVSTNKTGHKWVYYVMHLLRVGGVTAEAGVWLIRLRSTGTEFSTTPWAHVALEGLLCFCMCVWQTWPDNYSIL